MTGAAKTCVRRRFPQPRYIASRKRGEEAGHAVKYHRWPEYDCETMLMRAIVPVTSIHAKAAFERVGGFDPAFEEMLEDWEYNVRLMRAGYCGHRVLEHVMVYRQHPGARSRKGRDVLRRMRMLLGGKHRDAGEGNMPCW